MGERGRTSFGERNGGVPTWGENRLTMLCEMDGEDAVRRRQSTAGCPEAGASGGEGGGSQRAAGGTVPTRGRNRLTMLPEGGAPGSLKISASSHSVNIILVPRAGGGKFQTTGGGLKLGSPNGRAGLKFESPDSNLSPPVGGQDSNLSPRTQI